MKKFVITTDSNGDLPLEYLENNSIRVLNLSFVLEGINYTNPRELNFKDFYDAMRKGSMPTTSQVNPEAAMEVFKDIVVNQEADILHIAFSSGLSGSYNSAKIAAQEVMEEYPDSNIVVIDTLAASLGQGLFVYYANLLKNQGKELDEVVTWLEDRKLRVCHSFTVDDLFHLYRGGRVSKTSAIVGTMISVKPILRIDEEGHLVPQGKARGRKKSIQMLVETLKSQIGSRTKENEILFISHGDCLEDAEYLAKLAKEATGIENIMMNYVGPTIGAHSGPGTLAIFFIGEKR